MKIYDRDGPNKVVGDAVGAIVSLTSGDVEGLAIDCFLGALDGVAVDDAGGRALGSAMGFTL